LENYKTYSDEQLFHLIAVDNHYAYKELFHRFVPRLKPAILKITKTEWATDDLIQDVFYKIWINRYELVHVNNVRGYILKMAFNASFEYLRKQQTNKKAIGFITNNNLSDYSVTPEDNTVYNETNRVINEATKKLPPKTRLIYSLSNEQGLHPAEIATQLDLSTQTVRNTLTRAVSTIRKYLNQHDISLHLIVFYFFWNQ
jgi:RNA polymerase sigma factor (sigma-70 family)